MSLFDWGNRSFEHTQAQRRLEMDALYEQAVRMAKIKAMQGAGGGGNTIHGIYGVSTTNGKVYQVAGLSESKYYLIDSEGFTFNNPVAFAVNPTDGLVYGISGDSFFKFNKVTRELTEIDSNIEDLHIKGTSSFFYEGDGNFIYVDNMYKNTITSVIRINEDGTTTQLFEQDAETDNYFIRSLFKYTGDIWAASWNPVGPETTLAIFKIDVLSGTQLTTPIQITLSVPGVTEYDIYSLYNVISIGDKVYASIGWYDELDNRTSLFQINMSTGYAKLVQELTNADDDIYIWNISYF